LEPNKTEGLTHNVTLQYNVFLKMHTKFGQRNYEEAVLVQAETSKKNFADLAEIYSESKDSTVC
jgi:hypothetical protein